MNELTQRGINALKAGDRPSARKLLAAALQQDQSDVMAWLWLAAAVDTPGQRIDCLRQVLKIDPENQAAQKGLAALGASQEAAVIQSSEYDQPPADEPVEIDMEPGTDKPTGAGDPWAMDDRLAEVTATNNTEPIDTQLAPAGNPVAAEAPVPAAVTEVSPVVEEISIPPAYRPPHRVEFDEENARKVFSVRPSNVPALLAFWVFFIGAIVIGSQISAFTPDGTFPVDGPLGGLPLAMFGFLFGLALGLLLELVVLYVVIRNMRTHYELNTAALTIPFRGRRVKIPVSEIYHVECRQSLSQRLYGAGDVLLDAAVQGELAHLRLRSVPGCKIHAEEIASLIPGSGAGDSF